MAIPLALVALSFVLWGTQGIFQGRAPNAIAKVGDREVSIDAFDRELTQAVRRIQRQAPGFTTAQAIQFGFDRQVLGNLINNAALNEEAEELGIATSDAQVLEVIQQLPQFRNAAGAFDRRLYEQLLRSEGLTPERLEADLRQDLRRNQLLWAVGGLGTAPTGLAGILYAYDNEERRVTLVEVPPSVVGPIDAPDEATLRSFHQARPQAFSVPERRAVSFVRVRIEDYLDEIEITDEAIAAAFDRARDQLNTPERRQIVQLVFESREAAEAAAAEIAGGAEFETFAETATAGGARRIDLGLVTRSGVIDPAVAEAGFALPAEGAVSAVVEADIGPSLLRLAALQPGTTVSLEDVREEIRPQLASSDAARLQVTEFEAFEDRRLEGMTLEEAAAASGFEVVSLPMIAMDGETAEGARPEALPEDPEFLLTAFDTFEGETSDPLYLGDESAVVLRVDTVEPAHVRPFEEVRSEVEAEWLAAERGNRLRERVLALSRAADEGEDLESLARSIESTARSRREPVRRDTADVTISPSLTQAIFAGRKGETVFGPAGEGEGFVLARIDEIVRPDLAAASAAIEADARRLSQTVRNELLQGYVTALRSQAGVRVYEERIEAIRARYAGEAGEAGAEP
ncbi:MAG: SurA N-terminal domain-containing protein [Alphaproteobacteria bacterium]|nr:SurA N-terminal domain-containing protein [Alphaproteobacteria bacterium]